MKNKAKIGMVLLPALATIGLSEGSEGKAQQEPNLLIEDKVLLYADTKTLEGVVTNEFKPNDEFIFTIYANSYGLHGQKVGCIMASIYNAGLPLEPIHTSYGEYKQHYGTNDVFYPLALDFNEISVKFIDRATRFNPFSGSEGFEKKDEVYAMFKGKVPEDAKSGQYPIRFDTIMVYSNVDLNRDPNTLHYDSHCRNYAVAVKRPEDEAPVVALTSNRENDYVVHVAANTNQVANLYRSDDLVNWERVASSRERGFEGKGSFDWIDNDANGKNYTFYKADAAKEEN